MRPRLLRFLASLFRQWALRRRVETTDGVLAVARASVRRKKFCVLATRSAEGVDARVVEPFPPDPDFGVWLGTSAGSRKVAQLRACERATLVYADDRANACVTLVGRARIVEDRDLARRHFQPLWWAFFPVGPASREFVLVRFETERLEVVAFRRGVAPDPFGLAGAVVRRRPEGWVLDAAGRPRPRPEDSAEGVGGSADFSRS